MLCDTVNTAEYQPERAAHFECIYHNYSLQQQFYSSTTLTSVLMPDRTLLSSAI